MGDVRYRRQQPDVRPLWPGNGFLSPVMPGPHMPLPPPLPYGMPPTMPYTTPVPCYPHPQQVFHGDPTTGYNHFRGSVHTHVFETQRTEVQRYNFAANTQNDFADVQNPNSTQPDTVCGLESNEHLLKDSPRSLTNINSSDDQGANIPSCDDSSNDTSHGVYSASTFKANTYNDTHAAIYNFDGTVTVSQSKYKELTRLALHGSEIAEKLAYTHRNRPCFKKIDSLCARLKQDLVRPDSVLPNINSQGTAWAIKDLIFVFTRLISAWIILKGYMFNTPAGLNKVKSSLCPELEKRFLVWQDATIGLVGSLIRSFVSLDNLVQTQKTPHQKSSENMGGNGGGGGGNGTGGGGGVNTHSSPNNQSGSSSIFDDKFETFDNHAENAPSSSDTNINNYLYTMVKDSENSQREATVNGTYFKTGTYNPIKKDDFRDEGVLNGDNNNKCGQYIQPPPPSSSLRQSSSIVPSSNDMEQRPMPDSMTNIAAEPVMDKEIFEDEFIDEMFQKLYDNEIDSATVERTLCERLPSSFVNYGIRIFWRMIAERFVKNMQDDPAISESEDESVCYLPCLADRLLTMTSCDKFIKKSFSRNYFPGFIAKYGDDFDDIRTIVMRCQESEYADIYIAVCDVRKIFYFAKLYLQTNVDHNLAKIINEFQVEFNNMLHKEPFNMYSYDHITGAPMDSQPFHYNFDH